MKVRVTFPLLCNVVHLRTYKGRCNKPISAFVYIDGADQSDCSILPTFLNLLGHHCEKLYLRKSLPCTQILHFLRENELIRIAYEFFFKYVVGMCNAFLNKKNIGFRIGSYEMLTTEFMFNVVCVKKPT